MLSSLLSLLSLSSRLISLYWSLLISSSPDTSLSLAYPICFLVFLLLVTVDSSLFFSSISTQFPVALFSYLCDTMTGILECVRCLLHSVLLLLCHLCLRFRNPYSAGPWFSCQPALSGSRTLESHVPLVVFLVWMLAACLLAMGVEMDFEAGLVRGLSAEC